jgi:hypothetical protein|tara:strand:+ start:3265 stop:3657 length:393 start_codon:yes stop_codon:yes gene_type:complete
MSRKTIVFEGGVDNIRTLADNSLRVSLGTPELSPETVGNLYSILKQPGFVVLSTQPISQKQIDAVEAASIDMEFDTKTPAQRMRAVLYRLWEQTSPKEKNEEGTTQYVEFELFYKRKMNEIINHLKSKLD